MKDTKTVVKWERKFVHCATIRACEAVFVMKLSKTYVSTYVSVCS